MKKVLKSNIKIILGFILGLIWSIGIAYASTIYYASVNVSYDNTSSGLEATNVQDALDELYANSDAYLAGLNAAHPIGSIFMTVNSNYNTAAKVGTALGGTWQAIGQGRVLIGAGTNDGYTFTVGGTQSEVTQKNAEGVIQQGSTNPLGEYTHQDTVEEMPSHFHKLYGGTGTASGISDYFGGSTATYGLSGSGNLQSEQVMERRGSNYYHNNIQPYLVVYMYKRTS